jgi:hypothetical protein
VLGALLGLSMNRVDLTPKVMSPGHIKLADIKQSGMV